VQTVVDFNFAISTTTPGSQTVQPGAAATYAFNLSPASGPFPYPITLSATGLPPGATVTFTPPVITLGASPTSFTMTIQTAATSAVLPRSRYFGFGYSDGTIALGLLLLPFSRRFRRKAHGMRPLTLSVALILSFAAVSGLAGCGSGSGFFGQVQQSYTISVTGTATGAAGATLQHSTTVTLTVQ
jgi:hypothetical protein